MAAHKEEALLRVRVREKTPEIPCCTFSKKKERCRKKPIRHGMNRNLMVLQTGAV